MKTFKITWRHVETYGGDIFIDAESLEDAKDQVRQMEYEDEKAFELSSDHFIDNSFNTVVTEQK